MPGSSSARRWAPPDADGLHRGLHRAFDRGRRRSGQPAADGGRCEVLRGDLPDRADLASGRPQLHRDLRKRCSTSFTPEQQAIVQQAADDAAELGRQRQLALEAELGAFLEENGLTLYEPDLAAFRETVQAAYLGSEFAETWPEGVLEQINALGN
jgi:hypothetical protein